MYNYAQLKRFHHDRQLQFYMYAFMYVDPDTMPVEDYFPAKKKVVVDYMKMSTIRIVPKHWRVFSYIH